MTAPCPGCGRPWSDCPARGDECWRNNGCPSTPPDRVPIRPIPAPNSGAAYPDRCRASWRPTQTLGVWRVWPGPDAKLFWPGPLPGHVRTYPL